MQLLQWTDRYATGIATADQAHRSLIECVNRLHDGLFADDLTADRFLTCLLDEISTRFASEELALRESADEGRFADHKQDHDRLLDEVRDIIEATGQCDDIDSLELAFRLDGWFAHHFTTYDAQSVRAAQ
jgi:hemerythrin